MERRNGLGSKSWLFAGVVVLALRLVSGVYLALISAGLPLLTCADFPCAPLEYESLTDGGFSRLFLAPWYRWDSVHYLDIADSSYDVYGVENTVWPPLYPLLIRIFALLMPEMAAALLISTLAAWAALAWLHQEVCARYGERARWDNNLADRTLIVLAVFPTAFFLVAGYSEALFLAFSIAVFRQIRLRRWLPAAVFAGLATLTRLQGVLLALPLAWEALCWLRERHAASENPQGGIAGYLRLIRERSFWQQLGRQQPVAAAMVPPLVLALYFVYVHFGLGAPWPWQTLAGHWGQHFGWPGEGVVNNLLFVIRNRFSLIHISMIYDVLLLLLACWLLLRKMPGMPAIYRLYGLGIVLLPALRVSDNWHTLTSISRYVLMAFPVFIALAWSLFEGSRIRRMLWFGFSLASQLILLFLFTRWVWVA